MATTDNDPRGRGPDGVDSGQPGKPVFAMREPEIAKEIRAVETRIERGEATASEVGRLQDLREALTAFVEARRTIAKRRTIAERKSSETQAPQGEEVDPSLVPPGLGGTRTTRL